MQLAIGNGTLATAYLFPANGVRVRSSRQIDRGEDGVPYQYVDRVECDGYLEAAGQAALSAQEVVLKAVLLRGFATIALVQDDGNNSSVVLNNATSLTGVVVTDGPNFKDVNGPEFVSQRHFDFKAEADYAIPAAALNLLDWQETVEIDGGDALMVVKDAIEGDGQVQIVYEREKCTATQSGYAVGYLDYPQIAPAIWPFALKRRRPRVRRTSARARGPRTRRRYTQYRIEWTWTYEWPTPLVGVPTPWVF